MKHLEVRQLRAQEKVREGRATVSWISRCRNAADALTHQCSAAQMKEHMCRVGTEVWSDHGLSAQKEVLGACAWRCGKDALDPPPSVLDRID